VSTVRLVLCLTLLASSLGFAQTPEEVAPVSSEPSRPPLLPAPGQAEPPPPEGESIPYTYRPTSEARSASSSNRILFELLAGAGTGAVAGVAGIFTGALLAGFDCADLECVLPILGSMSVGILVGTPLGVYGAGRAMDGRGKYWASLVGTTLGSLAGLTLAVGASSIGSDALTILSLIAGPLIGAVLGYELSHSSADPGPRVPLSTSSAGKSVQFGALFSVTPSGSILGGLMGRF
jgi:hypothetical protein